MTHIELRGVSELMAKLGRIKGPAIMEGVMTAAASDVKDWVAQYPPPTGGNGRTWYERGFGTRWMRKDGSIGGRRTSETLGRRWTTRVFDGGMSAEVGNNVSYGMWVQDRDTQARVHRGRWRTVQEAIEVMGPQVIEKIRTAIERILGG